MSSVFAHTKNTPRYLALPMIDSAFPATFKSGLSVSTDAYYKDTGGTWTALALSDAFTEIGSTGVYEIDLTASEMNHDQVLIKMTATGAGDQMVTLDMTA